MKRGHGFTRDAELLVAQRRRLRRAFRLAMLSLGGPAILQTACGSDESAAPSSDAAVHDATGGSAMADADAGVLRDASAEAPTSDGSVDALAMEGSPPDAASVLLFTFPTCADASASAPYMGDSSAAGSQCYYYIDLSCPLYAPIANDCFLTATDCLKVCTLDAGIYECLYMPGGCPPASRPPEAGPGVTVGCGICPQGRRPSRLPEPPDVAFTSTLGGHYARAAYLEAASVHAFRRLETELYAHGAPRELVECARRAGRDEIRHARVTARLARRHGATATPPRMRRLRVRLLEPVARENMVEGCVRETFGAAVAMWQAVHARDADVRRCMARIAGDELRHAALAWAIARWADTRLTARARTRVARARRKAIRDLREEFLADPDRALMIEAGLPSSRQARGLVAALAEHLWTT